MGLLVQGTPLTWQASEPYRNKVKTDGVTQFLNVYKAAKDVFSPTLKWGDEVEYMLVKIDKDRGEARLAVSAPQLLTVLQREEHSQPPGSTVPVLWRPEYATWMIEGTPGVPYRSYAADLALVEQNMALRRQDMQKLLQDDEVALTLTAFPRQGCPRFTFPDTWPGGPVARSLFTSDDNICPHPRFATLTRNIRLRRGQKVDIRVPLFIDEHTDTNRPLLHDDPEYLRMLEKSSVNVVDASHLEKGDSSFMTLAEARRTTVGPHIVMDSAAFGMGCCCLQVTLQARDIDESRYLYDQLAVMAPIMLSLTAATPALHGMLAETDVRWSVISSSMDDRTTAECESGKTPKSRYSSIDCYISDRPKAKADSYNDIPVTIHQETYDRLIAAGLDHLLAQHVAHLYIRDPLVIFGDRVDQDNTESADHFENIQSTNWNTVRFKPPPPASDIGWRTEFRSMEVSLTDFENAAFSVFMVLLSRVILAFDLNLYIPMSLVDKNMDIAHGRSSARDGLFHFRRNILSSSRGSGFVCACGHIHHASIVGGDSNVEEIGKYCREHSDSESSDGESESFGLLRLSEILNGKALCENGRQAGFAFPGMIPLIRGYLESINVDLVTKTRLMTYLDFVSERASGKLCTTAEFLRRSVVRHADYGKDSVVSETICYDLMETCRDITCGKIGAPDLLGRFHFERYGGQQSSKSMMERMRQELVGAEASTLAGSSLPRSALANTINAMAHQAMADPCHTC
jgi:glutamate--cysteine ligase catalytic subunit